MTRKALVVGSNFSAIPIVFALKKRGFNITVCGNRLDEPCHDHADSSVDLDYSDEEALLREMESGRYDLLVPTGNDVSFRSCAYVAERLGLPGWDSVEVTRILHEKAAFRRFMRENELPGPRSKAFGPNDSILVGEFAYPLLVKPTDSYSGRGVVTVRDAAQLPAAVAEARKHARNGEIVVEEFIEGQLSSHSAFVRDGKIIYDVFADEYCTVYPYQVDCSHHPSALTERARGAMRAAMGRIVSLLALNDGLLHTQFIWRGDDVWIIEPMRRSPGDLYGHMIDLSLGIGYSDLVVALLLGEAIEIKPRFDPPRLVGRHTVSTKSGKITPLSFTAEIPGAVAQIAPLRVTGKLLSPAPYDKLAILFARFEDFEQMRDVVPDFASYIRLQTMEGEFAW
ncbi:acetyl-CoA carboxylase biotin carboxylase subunit family protein [Rhizobium sp. L1K21]|uniref:ATP-grasp domain-containing protein n=1 Tax=Rhizobium sp. L1K21 TaxID=2954933 RepID=UPI002093E539|nr:ATP-grasp domain-containing protein [Rhizobium sp. L1K21]MCO6188387.1 ATP-grasp domain-containing protein [Rhizobium sp. L1K21]